MLKDIIAKRYAKALLSLATDSKETDAVKKDLAAVAELFRANKNVQNVVLNPAFSSGDKAAVLKGLAAGLGVSATSARFLDLLVEKGRFRFIKEVSAAYSDLLDAQQGRVKATVTSAEALSDADVTRLKDKLKVMVGKEVELKVEVEPELIGGIKTKIGSTVYDGSLKNQVKLVREALLRT